MRCCATVLFPLLLWSSLLPAAKPALMLANTYHDDIDLGAYWVSEKLDGVRAYWNGRQLISRGGNPIAAPAWFTDPLPATPLDGELWAGRRGFERVSATVLATAADDSQWRALAYWVFDLPASPLRFNERLPRLQALVAAANAPQLRLVQQVRLASKEALMTRLERVVAAGGEGLMLHRGDSLYRGQRSDDLIKLKTYADAEAVVIAQLPGKGKYAGKLGALLVQTADGRRFRLGSGFSDRERQAPPPIGAQVTYKYYGTSANGIPRFASFLRIRSAP